MIELVDFKPEHVENIKKDDLDTNIFSFIGSLDQRAIGYAAGGPAITLIDGDEVLATGGILKFWQGVGEAWLMVSPKGRTNMMSLYKYMESFMTLCGTKWGFHRVQASIYEKHNIAHKCAFRLGFIPEGSMVCYGPNKEMFIRYVRFF